MSDHKLQRLEELASRLAGFGAQDEEVLAFKATMQAAASRSSDKDQISPPQPESGPEAMTAAAQADAEAHRLSEILPDISPHELDTPVQTIAADAPSLGSEMALRNQTPSSRGDATRFVLTIHLRWVLRDIRARRTNFLPTSRDDLKTLIELGLVKMKDSIPVLTPEGEEAIR